MCSCDTTPTEMYTLSLHDALPIYGGYNQVCNIGGEIKDPERTIPNSIVLSTFLVAALYMLMTIVILGRSEEHTSELQSRLHLVCRPLLEKKKTRQHTPMHMPTLAR